MRRGHAQGHDSLDMLLDTISNTFGGILFLALLVAILVRFNGNEVMKQRAESTSNEDLSELRNTLAQMTTTLKSNMQALETQRNTLANFKPIQSRPLIDEILSLRGSKNKLVQQRMDLGTKVSQLRSRNVELDSHLQDIGSRHEDARQENSRLHEALRAEVRKRTRMARLPALRATNKWEFAVVLRYGRLYFLHATELDKQSGVLNYDDFVVLADEESTIRITPKPYAGLVVDESETLDDLLKEKLVNLDTDESYLAIGVWEDSFGNFVHLRNSLVELGWEYRLLPIEQSGVITESHTGKPLVQ